VRCFLVFLLGFKGEGRGFAVLAVEGFCGSWLHFCFVSFLFSLCKCSFCILPVY
jgi:hypothetical protein